MIRSLYKNISIILLIIIVSGFVPPPKPALAAAPVVESYTSTGTISGVGTTISINLPSGVSSGDLLVACIGAAGDNTSNMSATGWTHVTTTGGGGTQSKIGILWRFWQSGDSDPATFTISDGNSLSLRRAVMWRISGASSTPSDATPSSNIVSTGQTHRTYNSITTATDDALVVGCLHWASNDTTYTADSDLTTTATANRFAADTATQATAGATGNFTGSGNAAPYTSALWAIAPGSGPSNSQPTIALNSPADSATGVSTTTSLTFTGSDANSDDLTYEIEITDNPDNFIGGEVLGDNFSGGSGGSFHPQPHSSANTWQGNIQVDDRMCQSFTALGGKWSRAVFPLGDSRTDTSGTAYARLYTHSGTYGASSAPVNAGSPNDQTNSGTPTVGWIAASDGVSLGASFSSGNFDFDASGSDQIRLTDGQNYLVCGDWIPDDRLENNTWAWTGDVLNSGSLHAGNLYHDGYSSANHGVHDDWDLHFSIYETFTLTGATSSAHAGFANEDNGADTSPFTAGDQVSYTIQSALDESVTYYWRVRAGDGSATSTWSSTRSFTTADGTDTTAPTVSSFSPTDNSTDIATTTNLVITFDENIYASSTGNIVIKKSSDDSTVETIPADDNRVSTSTVTATINPNTLLDYSTSYYIQIDSGAFEDSSGNGYTGISDTTTWNFTTGDEPDTTAPTVSTLSPTDDATDVATTTNLVITFNENIYASSTGDIVIKKSSDDSTVETIPADDNRVSTSTVTATINPNTLLDYSTSYYIQIDSGAFEDASGNGYAGISNTTTWNFTTGDEPDTTAPTRSSGSPSGALSAGTTSTTLRVTTDENATCKYSTTSGTAYASISNTFSTTGGTSHSTTVSSLSAGSYSYYVRCTDGSGNANTNDFTISFSISGTSTIGGGGILVQAGGSSSITTPRIVSLLYLGQELLPADFYSKTETEQLAILQGIINLLAEKLREIIERFFTI